MDGVPNRGFDGIIKSESKEKISEDLFEDLIEEEI